jgi:uncharacterized protein
MSLKNQHLTLLGPAGALECVLDFPADAWRGVVVVCHPNPLFGGTLDNKVVQTLVRAFVALGYKTVRFNFRGVGASEGVCGEGLGEVADALAVVHAQRDASLPLILAGFSFGAYVAAEVAASLGALALAQRLLLVAPSTQKQTVPAVPADTLVVHGELDDVVPLSSTLNWARPQGLPVVVVPGAGHFFHGQLTLLKNLVVRYWHV